MSSSLELSKNNNNESQALDVGGLKRFRHIEEILGFLEEKTKMNFSVVGGVLLDRV
jgi:hypothetical protein